MRQPPEVQPADIKVVFLDCDGVLFDGREFRALLPTGELLITKVSHFRDRQGISMMRAIGLWIVFVTGDTNVIGSLVERWNALPSAQNGAWKKVVALTGKNARGEKVQAMATWLKEHGLAWRDAAYMGDDLNDVGPMAHVGIAFAPSDAARCARNAAHHVMSAKGGNGAIREMSERLLDARGVDESTLPPA
ncbi:MAG: HAD hydrolase family protein [Minisyncoccia bacterium]